LPTQTIFAQKIFHPFFPQYHTTEPSLQAIYTFSFRFATIRPDRHHEDGPYHSKHKEFTMGKSQDARKETKKKPAKTMKEKRAEKRAQK
jgi:hypothetical protein